jgi:hypothetical protein
MIANRILLGVAVLLAAATPSLAETIDIAIGHQSMAPTPTPRAS